MGATLVQAGPATAFPRLNSVADVSVRESNAVFIIMRGGSGNREAAAPLLRALPNNFILLLDIRGTNGLDSDAVSALIGLSNRSTTNGVNIIADQAKLPSALKPILRTVSNEDAPLKVSGTRFSNWQLYNQTPSSLASDPVEPDGTSRVMSVFEKALDGVVSLETASAPKFSGAAIARNLEPVLKADFTANAQLTSESIDGRNYQLVKLTCTKFNEIDGPEQLGLLLVKLLNERHSPVRVDLLGGTLDECCIGALVRCSRLHFQRLQTPLELTNISATMRKTFEITALVRLQSIKID